MTPQLQTDLADLRQWLDGIIELADSTPNGPWRYSETGTLIYGKDDDGWSIMGSTHGLDAQAHRIGHFIARSHTITPLMARMMKTCLDALEKICNFETSTFDSEVPGDMQYEAVAALQSLITQWKEAVK